MKCFGDILVGEKNKFFGFMSLNLERGDYLIVMIMLIVMEKI